MSARIICMCNQKGGCGKTTLSMALGAGASRRGYNTLIVDGDRQGSAVSWSTNARAEDPAFPAAVVNLSHAGSNLPRTVETLSSNYDLIVIDCPPAVDSPIAQAALKITHLALIPVKPSPVDLASLTPFLELAQQMAVFNEALQVRIVPNMVQLTQVHNAYIEQLAKLPAPCLNARVRLRTAHEQACALGASIHTVGDAKAAAEADKLLDEVLQIIGLPTHNPRPSAT